MLWAVHISDGVLTWHWCLGGFVLIAALAYWGGRKLRDEEIPRIALITAAVFVGSLIPIPVGPTSIHLLLNGLAGVLLGWRVALVIPLALFLQFFLFSIGGISSLGVNACIMVFPALGASLIFSLLKRLPWLRYSWFRSSLVFLSCAIWLVSLVYGVAYLVMSAPPTLSLEGPFQPLTWVLVFSLAFVIAWIERKLENSPEFPLGLVIGELTVLVTVALNCLALLWGGETDWTYPALILVISHLPFAVVEGLVLGFTVGFLAKVKPEMLGHFKLNHQVANKASKREVAMVPLETPLRVALPTGPNQG